jgi:hypothetical protein
MQHCERLKRHARPEATGMKQAATEIVQQQGCETGSRSLRIRPSHDHELAKRSDQGDFLYPIDGQVEGLQENF